MERILRQVREYRPGRLQIELRRAGTVRSTIVVSLLAVATLVAAPATRAETINIGEGIYFGWAPFLVADAEKLWEKQGLTPTVTQFPTGRQVLDAVLAGHTDIGTASETPPILAAVNGQPVRIVAVLNRLKSFDLVTTRDISDPAQLKGKRVGFAQGTNGHFYLYKLLGKFGLQWSDVTAVNLPATDFPTAIANGNIDAFIWGEPMISQALQRAGDRVHVIENPAAYFGYSVAITSAQTLADKPDLLAKALKALIEANRLIDTDRAKAAAIVSDKIKLDPTIADQVLQTLRNEVSLDADAMVADFEEQAQWAIDSNLARPGAKVPDFRTVLFAPGPLELARQP